MPIQPFLRMIKPIRLAVILTTSNHRERAQRVAPLGWIAIVSNVGRKDSHRLLLSLDQKPSDVILWPSINMVCKPIRFDQSG